MISPHHRSITYWVFRLLNRKGPEVDQIIAASSAPDNLADVLVHVPGQDAPQANLAGRWAASFCHFEPAYCWDKDPSLRGGLGAIGTIGMHASGMTVIGKSQPMLDACAAQPGVVLSGFVFPSASRMGSHWSTLPEPFWQGCACHAVEDTCVPFHAWGAILWGHREFEDDLWAKWRRRCEIAALASDENAFLDGLREACDRERITATTVEQLCRDNADWARAWFGEPHELAECTANQELAICVRAIASTRRGLEIMKGTP